MESKVDIAFIGGTGLYDIEGLENKKNIRIETPWGYPSDEITIAEFQCNKETLKAAFLPRHGRGHFIMPGEINQKANMAALKMLGTKSVIAFSAVGSLKEEIEPEQFILPNQIIDRTRNREDSFYGDGIVVHVSFGDPFSIILAKYIEQSLKNAEIKYHLDETLICMEGPSFSTRAESKLYKSWGAGIINMSVLPEAKFARELELSYQMVCMATDYDSWREETSSVSADEIMKVLSGNSAKAKKVILDLLDNYHNLDLSSCEAQTAVKHGIITAPEKRNPQAVEKLKLVLPERF